LTKIAVSTFLSDFLAADAVPLLRRLDLEFRDLGGPALRNHKNSALAFTNWVQTMSGLRDNLNLEYLNLRSLGGDRLLESKECTEMGPGVSIQVVRGLFERSIWPFLGEEIMAMAGRGKVRGNVSHFRATMVVGDQTWIHYCLRKKKSVVPAKLRWGLSDYAVSMLVPISIGDNDNTANPSKERLGSTGNESEGNERWVEEVWITDSTV
jgi:hypothetical protein